MKRWKYIRTLLSDCGYTSIESAKNITISYIDNDFKLHYNDNGENKMCPCDCGNEFIFTVAVSDNTIVKIPHSDDITYIHNYDIDYGDGNKLHVSSYNDKNITHIYSVAGTYQIKINGVCDSFSMNFDTEDIKSKIISVDSWGNGGLKLLSLQSCDNLITLPNEYGKLINIKTFAGVFYGCTLLNSIPPGIFYGNINPIDFYYTFGNCTSLTTIPPNLFQDNVNATNFNFTFGGCSSLIIIPTELFDNNIDVTSFNSVFYKCASLTTIPSGLFDNNINVTTFQNTFYSCTSLTGLAPELWLINPTPIGKGCFYKNNNLSNYSSIPSGWTTDK